MKLGRRLRAVGLFVYMARLERIFFAVLQHSGSSIPAAYGFFLTYLAHSASMGASTATSSSTSAQCAILAALSRFSQVADAGLELHRVRRPHRSTSK